MKDKLSNQKRLYDDKLLLIKTDSEDLRNKLRILEEENKHLNVLNKEQHIKVIKNFLFDLKLVYLWLLKGIRGGVHLDFYQLILFYRVLSELSDIFNRLKKIKVIFEIWAIKVGDLNRFLIEGAN